MTDSVRELVQAAAATALGGDWGVPAPQDEADLPFTSLDDGTDTTVQTEYDGTWLQMSVVVTRAALATSSDKVVMRKQANALYAELIAELQGVDETLGGVADGIDFLGGGTLAEVGKFVFALVNFNIRYHHLNGDPYTIEN